jgi:hypothetical protein
MHGLTMHRKEERITNELICSPAFVNISTEEMFGKEQPDGKDHVNKKEAITESCVLACLLLNNKYKKTGWKKYSITCHKKQEPL